MIQCYHGNGRRTAAWDDAILDRAPAAQRANPHQERSDRMSIDEKQFDGMEWIKAELEDSFDEDFELELSEPAISMELRKLYKRKHPATLDRLTYFKSLLTLHSSPARADPL
jgi:hypothetical protein